jgi:hypothetical protein
MIIQGTFFSFLHKGHKLFFYPKKIVCNYKMSRFIREYFYNLLKFIFYVLSNIRSYVPGSTKPLANESTDRRS